MKKEELEKKITEAFKKVIDPELGYNFVDLGLLYGIDIDEDNLKLKVTIGLTTPMCPLAGMLYSQSVDALEAIPELKGWDVEVKVDIDTPWTPDRMTEELRNTLGL